MIVIKLTEALLKGTMYGDEVQHMVFQDVPYTPRNTV